jgi:hypothetical protein
MWPHVTSLTNTRLRSHLILPTAIAKLFNCTLRVGNESRLLLAVDDEQTEQDRWITFDDSYEQEMWCNHTLTDEERIAAAAGRIVALLFLTIDTWHPRVSDGRRAELQLINSLSPLPVN